jgi:cytochrome c551/c552
MGRIALILLTALTGAVEASPRSDFLLHCAGCHQADATGLPPSVPSLAGPLGRIAASPEGRDYLARVPGASQAPISDEELAAVLNWVLAEFNRETLPASFKPLTGKQVGKSRSRVLADPLKLRKQLWPDEPGY